MTSITAASAEEPPDDKIIPPSTVLKSRIKYDRQECVRPPSEPKIHSNKCDAATSGKCEDKGPPVPRSQCAPNLSHNDRGESTVDIIWKVATETMCFNLVLGMVYMLFLLYKDVLYRPIVMIKLMADNAAKLEALKE